jgi:tetratricopeptide (TPR) repeat protein
VARELFLQGRDAYTEGRFEEARELFQRSYDLSGRPGLLYNIAQAAERTRDDEHALQLYRAFLEAVPDAPERDFVEARIVFLSERVRQQQSDATDGVEPEGEAGGLDLGPLPVALVVGGGALAAGGAALLAVGIRGRNQVEGASDGSDYASVRSGGERARGLGYAGQVALGVGVAAALTGVVLFALSGSDDDGPRDGSAGRSTPQLALGVGLGHISLSGSF